MISRTHARRRRRGFRALVDRFTPYRMRVWYCHTGIEGRYAWGCNRCTRDNGFVERAGGFTRSLAAAQARAKDHARQHTLMRAVHLEV